MIAEPFPGSPSGLAQAFPEAPSGFPHGRPDSDPLSRFAGGVAHDFNNLLTIINGYSELILASDPGPAMLREYVREILSAGNKAAEIVGMILAYAGGGIFSMETFDVNPMIEGLGNALDGRLGPAVSLHLDLCRGPARVKSEPGLLQWGLVNMVLNAKEAMPEGGRIDLATRIIPEPDHGGLDGDMPGPCVEISVRDTGRGMAKDELERVFEPYFSTKRCGTPRGLGLTLACVHGVVRQSRGRIWAQSEPGAGSVFRIRLPAHDGDR